MCRIHSSPADWFCCLNFHFCWCLTMNSLRYEYNIPLVECPNIQRITHWNFTHAYTEQLTPRSRLRMFPDPRTPSVASQASKPLPCSWTSHKWKDIPCPCASLFPFSHHFLFPLRPSFLLLSVLFYWWMVPRDCDATCMALCISSRACMHAFLLDMHLSVHQV